jgi:hypothetical protein
MALELEPERLASRSRMWQGMMMRRELGLATIGLAWNLALLAGCGGKASSDGWPSAAPAAPPVSVGGLPPRGSASGGAGSVAPGVMRGAGTAAPAPATGGAGGEGPGVPPEAPPMVGQQPETVPPVMVDAGAGPDHSGGPAPVGPDECAALRVLNPNDVYILGTLIEGQAQFDALAHWSDPNRALVGFPGGLEEESVVIHPIDGTLFYMESFGDNYRFQSGRCLLRGDSLPGYPEPGANADPIVPFPCEPRTYGRTLLINPQGAIAVDCVDSWRDLEGRVLYAGQLQVLSYGSPGRLLTREGVFSIDEQALHPFVGLPDISERYPRAWRAVSERFWFVLPAEDSEFDRELWAIDASGVATLVGRYAPSDMVPGYGNAIAADGTLFETVFAAGVINDYIQRRTFTSSELVYDEAGDPLVKLHGSRLVTAP